MNRRDWLKKIGIFGTGLILSNSMFGKIVLSKINELEFSKKISGKIFFGVWRRRLIRLKGHGILKARANRLGIIFRESQKQLNEAKR